MVLRLARGPKQGLEAVARALLPIVLDRRGRPPRDDGVTCPPVPLFVLSPDALDEERPLDHVVHVGWHYVARRGSLEAAVELAVAEDGTLRPSRIRTGNRARAVLRVARRAEADHVPGEVLEVRILRIPPFHLEALWLAGPRTDHFLPLDRRRKAFRFLEEARTRREQRRAGGEIESEALSD